jgi:signal transduction histidine kinase
MIHEAMLDMRLLIFELHPPILEKEGLVAALQARLEAVESRSGFETTFQVEGERRLPISIETEIYRIAQEALTNVVKHANAQEVRVHLLFDDRQFCMDVWDNGVGFDKQSIDHSGGLGLRGIRERVGQLGGSLTIDSLPGEGTTLQILLEI